MIAAQIKNIEADTKQKQATTQKTETVDTQETVTRIEKLAQETTNLKGQKVLMDIETWMKEIDSAIKEDTARDMVDKIHYEAQEQIAKAEMAFTDNYIKNETYESTIEAIRENAIGAMLQNRATILGFNKTSAEIQKIQTEITRMVNQTANEIRGLDQKDKELKIKEFDAWIKAHYPQVQQVMGYNINKLLVMQDRALEKIYGKSGYRDWETDRKSTRLNSSHSAKSRMPSSA